MTEEEAIEAMQVAMTVGATRMQVMLADARPAAPVDEGVARPAENAARPVENAAPAAPAPAAFTAAEVVPQAGGG